MKQLAVVILLFFLNPGLVSAQEIYQQRQLLFADKFETDLSLWLNENQTTGWSIDNGQLLAQDSGILRSGRLSSHDQWDNYSIELDLNNISGIDEGIGFRRSDSNNGYEVNLRHGSDLYQTPEIILSKVEGGQTVILKSVKPDSLVNQQWYKVKIEVFLTHIQVWLDNQLILEFDDPQTNLKTGGISLSYWTGDLGHSEVRFDNVQIYLINKHLNPVVFIPGIAGSELQADQDIIWSADDGHGGTFSRAYLANEKLWLNLIEAAWPGDDDYFDVLRLAADGQTSLAAVSPTGQLVSAGYGQIDQVFEQMGYTKGVNYFLLAYDWRKDIMTVSSALDALIETARQKNNQSQVNIIAHSMGGLVVRAYLNNQINSSKIHRLIEMGVPHLGAAKAAHDLVYGSPLGKTILGITIGVAASEVKDVLQNFPSIFQLIPSSVYSQFYPNWLEHQRDPSFNFLANLNQQANKLANDLHQQISPNNLAPEIKNHQIVGSGQPTLGQITESWWVDWPIKLIAKTDTTYFNGDGTVPLYSASLKSDKLDFSNQAKIYYVEENHNQLVQLNSLAFNLVQEILAEGDPSPLPAKPLAGIQLSVDFDAQIEIADPSNLYLLDKTGSTSHLFVAKKYQPIKVGIKVQSQKLNLKVRHYADNKIIKTDYYHQIESQPDQQLSLILDPSNLAAPIISHNSQQVTASAETFGLISTDQTPPLTRIQVNNRQVTLDTQDDGSGTLKTEYSLDGGRTIQLYTGPFIVDNSSSQSLIVSSIDKVGNQELPQTVTLKPPPSPSSSPSPQPSSTPPILIGNQKLKPPPIAPIQISPIQTNNAKPGYQATSLVMLSFLYAYLNARRLAGL